MQVIPYRNKHGALFKPNEKPYYVEGQKTSGGYLAANLVHCPETDGLRWIGHCLTCEYFKGHQRYQGVKCESAKAQSRTTHPAFIEADKTKKTNQLKTKPK